MNCERLHLRSVDVVTCVPLSPGSFPSLSNTEVLNAMWDHEVDVVCVGDGIGGLASAVVAADAGAEVFVAPSSQRPPSAGAVRETGRGWLIRAVDEATDDYFASLSCGLKPIALDAVSAPPSRVVEDIAPPPPTARKVEPFFGGRLSDWTTACLRSPFGVLHTRVAYRDMTTLRTLEGEAIQAKVVGVVPCSERRRGMTLADWMSMQAGMRDVEVAAVGPLRRIVFEEGVVVGAVFATAEGDYAVRARHGVTVTPDGQPAGAGRPLLAGGEESLHVCLVSRAGSRFGRLELLTAAGVAASRAVTCHAVNRVLHHGLRDARVGRSESRRGRKIHRYPPFGQ
jgi:hypothetical protein